MVQAEEALDTLVLVLFSYGVVLMQCLIKLNLWNWFTPQNLTFSYQLCLNRMAAAHCYCFAFEWFDC